VRVGMEKEGKTHGNSLFSHPVLHCETAWQTERAGPVVCGEPGAP